MNPEGQSSDPATGSATGRPLWHTPVLQTVTIDAVTSSYVRGGPVNDAFGTPGRTNNIS